MHSTRHLHKDVRPGVSDLFTGQALVGIEPSGRLALPAAWKHRLQGNGFVLPRLSEEEPYIMLFSSASLESRLKELKSKSHRETLLRSTPEVKIDGQGRVVIPEIVSLLGGASHAAILGSGDHLRVMTEQSAAYVTRYDEQVLEEEIL